MDLLLIHIGTAVKAESREGKKLSTYPELEASINEMKNYGVDLSNNVCKQLNQECLKGIDHVIVMAEEEYIPGWLKNFEYEKWNVENPSFVNPKIAKSVAEKLKAKILKMI